MRPDISEFSFGFAITSELTQQYTYAFVGAPQFPTQNEEGKVGYDVSLPRFGLPLFLQFKRSELLLRRNAGNAARLGVPHYRMHLRPRRLSDQHSLLFDLEASGQEVYYVAPRFSRYQELNDAYHADQVAQCSTFVKPSDIGLLPDDGDHHLDIKADGKVWLFCSDEPRAIASTSSEVILREQVVQAARQRRQKLDANYYRAFADNLVERFISRSRESSSRDRERAQRVRNTREPAEYAREVAQMMYGCELLVALAE